MKSIHMPFLHQKLMYIFILNTRIHTYISMYRFHNDNNCIMASAIDLNPRLFEMIAIF